MKLQLCQDKVRSARGSRSVSRSVLQKTFATVSVCDFPRSRPTVVNSISETFTSLSLSLAVVGGWFLIGADDPCRIINSIARYCGASALVRGAFTTRYLYPACARWIHG